MMPSPRTFWMIAAAGVLLAGAAQAQTVSPLDLRLRTRADAAATPVRLATPIGVAPGAVPDLADPLDPLAPTRLQAAVSGAVFAKTAVDGHFAGREDVTGSLGFLCGLQPGHTDQGGAAAYGFDPHGRFVGARLSFAFR